MYAGGMTQRFFTSDHHIRHDLVVRERGFFHEHPQTGELGLGNVQVVDHDAYEACIAADWDSRVGKDDLVFVLGDIALNPNKGAFDWFDARPGRKILISGNHDATAGFHSSASKAQKVWLNHFESIHDYLQIKFGDRRVLASHYPYVGEGEREMEDRHTQFRLRDEGMPLLHGHVHSKNVVTNGNQYHVGLDAHNLQLVHELEIIDWLDGRDKFSALS